MMQHQTKPSRRHILPATIVGLALAACASEPTIVGQITDSAINLEQQTAPQSVWLELTNVGSAECELLAVRTELPPDSLQVEEGRIVVGSSGLDGPASAMAAYVEIDGQPAGGEGVGAGGSHAVVQPGETARIQLALTGTPERAERVILCNGPGDYGSGRYVVLRFDR